MFIYVLFLFFFTKQTELHVLKSDRIKKIVLYDNIIDRF